MSDQYDQAKQAEVARAVLSAAITVLNVTREDILGGHGEVMKLTEMLRKKKDELEDYEYP